MPDSGFDQCFFLLMIGINKGIDVRVAYTKHVPHNNDKNHFRFSFLNKVKKQHLYFDNNYKYLDVQYASLITDRC